MRDLAKMIGISDVGLKKLLRAYDIDTPPQGHWNRVRAGRSVSAPPGPPARGPGVSGRVRLDQRFRGHESIEAMSMFAEWVHDICEEGGAPVFVGFNAPFDWSFVNYYFHRYCGSNPFGFAALDLKALFMGATGCRWSETSSKQIAKKLKPRSSGDHNALHDALYQAELFRAVRSIAAGVPEG